MLYFPWDTIHVGVSRSGAAVAGKPISPFSHRVTVSMCQKTDWSCFLEMAFQRALKKARAECLELRLPLNFLSFMGAVPAWSEEGSKKQITGRDPSPSKKALDCDPAELDHPGSLLQQRRTVFRRTFAGMCEILMEHEH